MLLAIFLRRNRKLPLKPTSTLRSGLTTRNTLLFRKNLTCLGRTLAFAGALAFGLAAQQGQAAVIFDNLSGTSNGTMVVSNTQSIAQAFTTTATDFVLTGVQLRLYNMNGTTGGYELQLWDATGASGSPGVQTGAALYTGLAQNLTATSGSLLSVTGLNRTLAANTTYYLVVAGTNLSSVALPGPAIPGIPAFSVPGSLAWSTTTTSTAGGGGMFSKPGATWSGMSGYGMMKIEAGPGSAASVPDAGHTPAALGVILAGLATLRRRLQP